MSNDSKESNPLLIFSEIADIEESLLSPLPKDTKFVPTVAALSKTPIKIPHRPKRITTRRNERRCSVEDCTKLARNRGLCTAHGGGKQCNYPDCISMSQSRGFCRSHGGGSRCKAENCTRSAQSRGLCRKHGGGQVCQADDCKMSTGSSTSEYCRKHKANFESTIQLKKLAEACVASLTSNGKPRSSQEGGKPKPRCGIAGCNSHAQSRGFCRAHGGGSRCKIEGCNTSAQSARLCRAHGGGKLCEAPGCVRNARVGGYCIGHGGGKRCKVTECSKNVQSAGLCRTHLRETKLDILCDSISMY